MASSYVINNGRFNILNPDLFSGNKVKEKFHEIIGINNSTITSKKLLTKIFCHIR